MRRVSLFVDQKCDGRKVREWCICKAKLSTYCEPSRSAAFASSNCGSPTAGTPQGVPRHPRGTRDALDQGMTFDGKLDRRLLAHPGVRRPRRPDLTTFQLLPWYDEGAGWRGSSATSSTSTAALDGCPRQQLRRVRGEAAPRATPSSSRPRSSTSTSRARDGRRHRCRSTAAVTSTYCPTTPRANCDDEPS